MSALVPEETASVEKADGSRKGPYRMKFAGDTIFVLDNTADIEEEDVILRVLPSGKEERNIIVKATFYNGRQGSLGPHYQVQFRKGPNKNDSRTSRTNNITIHHAGSIQIGDYNSQTIVNLFESLLAAIESSDVPEEEKAEARGRMEQFLKHPLVVSLLGVGAKKLFEVLSQHQ